jgi:hypothetical protein
MYRTSSHYGWKPDLPDIHDFVYSVPNEVTAKPLPDKVNLRDQCPAVYDQGQLGSCTANAIAAAFQFDLLKQKLPAFMPSRLFIYYNERSIENTVDKDSGAQVRDGMKSVARQGVCKEIDWPYVASEFSVKPFAKCYDWALQHRSREYHRVSRKLEDMKGCLAEGYPFVMGFTAYEAFESTEVGSNGVLNLPAAGEAVVGGHAVLVVGYDEQAQRFIVRNSWGTAWGDKGYFTMPYQYLLTPDLADDFWTIRSTTVASGPRVIEREAAAASTAGAAGKSTVSAVAPAAKKAGKGGGKRIKNAAAAARPVKVSHALITQPCASPGCGFTVSFDPADPPIPAINETNALLQLGKSGSNVTVYLSCGNPVTPHTLPYTMTLN